MKLVSSFLASFVKDVAEGKHGESLKAIYWKLEGKKTMTAVVIAFMYGIAQLGLTAVSACVPECATAESVTQMEAWLAYVPTAITFLIAVGLFDAAVRIEPPKK